MIRQLVRIASPAFYSVPWAGLALGPAGWALNTQINYALVSWACSHNLNPFPAIAASLAALSLAGTLSSWLAWRRYGGPNMPLPERDGHPSHLLSGIGVASGILFAIVILMQGIAAMLLEPCLR